MLVLSRRENEEIVIGEGANQIVVAVCQIRGDKVRIGIRAHCDTPVHRREVYDRIQREGGAA